MQTAVGEAFQSRDVPADFLPASGASRQRTQAHLASRRGRGAGRDLVLRLLNEALASEIACMLRYRRHYFLLRSRLTEAQKGELLDRANEEQLHADLLAQRIAQLGGTPDLSPLHICDMELAGFAEASTPADMMREELAAERIAMEVYAGMVRSIGDSDVVTRRLLEEILANEQEHAGELARMLEGFARESA